VRSFRLLGLVMALIAALGLAQGCAKSPVSNSTSAPPTAPPTSAPSATSVNVPAAAICHYLTVAEAQAVIPVPIRVVEPHDVNGEQSCRWTDDPQVQEHGVQLDVKCGQPVGLSTREAKNFADAQTEDISNVLGPNTLPFAWIFQGGSTVATMAPQPLNTPPNADDRSTCFLAVMTLDPVSTETAAHLLQKLHDAAKSEYGFM
jgi:hypothetical protein